MRYLLGNLEYVIPAKLVPERLNRGAGIQQLSELPGFPPPIAVEGRLPRE